MCSAFRSHAHSSHLTFLYTTWVVYSLPPFFLPLLGHNYAAFKQSQACVGFRNTSLSVLMADAVSSELTSILTKSELQQAKQHGLLTAGDLLCAGHIAIIDKLSALPSRSVQIYSRLAHQSVPQPKTALSLLNEGIDWSIPPHTHPSSTSYYRQDSSSPTLPRRRPRPTVSDSLATNDKRRRISSQCWEGTRQGYEAYSSTSTDNGTQCDDYMRDRLQHRRGRRHSPWNQPLFGSLSTGIRPPSTKVADVKLNGVRGEEMNDERLSSLAMDSNHVTEQNSRKFPPQAGKEKLSSEATTGSNDWLTPQQGIVEVVGLTGSGKSQIAMNAVVDMLLEDIEANVMRKEEEMVVYIQSRIGAFSSERIGQLVRAKIKKRRQVQRESQEGRQGIEWAKQWDEGEEEREIENAVVSVLRRVLVIACHQLSDLVSVVGSLKRIMSSEGKHYQDRHDADHHGHGDRLGDGPVEEEEKGTESCGLRGIIIDTITEIVGGEYTTLQSNDLLENVLRTLAKEQGMHDEGGDDNGMDSSMSNTSIGGSSYKTREQQLGTVASWLTELTDDGVAVLITSDLKFQGTYLFP